jgi:dolichyl-phosphate-mannose-protein mannosyltransferase
MTKLARPYAWWLIGAIVFGVVVRLALLPGQGFPDDISAFENWALALGTTGTSGFYADTSGVRYPALDYPPGYMYVLWLTGRVYAQLCHCTDHTLLLQVLEKLPAVLADFGVAFVSFAIARTVATERNAVAVFVALLVLPPLWLVSAYWGQVDSVACLALLLTLWAATGQRWVLMWALFAVTILIKPQAAPLAPLLLVWEWRTVGLTRAFPAGIAAAVAIGYLSTVPFTQNHGAVASARWLLGRYVNGISKYPYNTTGGFTLFGITGNYFQSDSQHVLGFPLHIWGIALFLALLAAVTIKLWLALAGSTSRLPLLASAYVVLAGLFVLSTRMHERYLMPALVLGAIVSAVDRRYALATLVYAATFTINCIYILIGFYGGGHHPVTLLAAHLFAAANVAALILVTVAFFRPRESGAPVSAHASRPAWPRPNALRLRS